MLGTRVRIPTLILSALLGLAACGGDDDSDDGGDTPDAGGDGTPDAGDIDAPEADAGVVRTRRGTVAITETVITNPLPPGAPVLGLQGGVVTATYLDVEGITVAPVPGYANIPPINSCLIFRYNRTNGDQDPPSVDEGEVTVTGTANGTITCRFESGAATYTCQPANAAIRGGVLGNANTATINVTGTFTLANAGFVPEMRGMQLQLTGFGKTVPDGRYGILAVIDSQTLQLSGIRAGAIGGAEATFTTFVGAGPVPITAATPGFDFLDNGTATMTITKAEGPVSPEYAVNIHAPGEGWALAETSSIPHEFPATPEDVTYSCDENCGAAPDLDGAISVMTINGVTTDVLPQANDPFGIGMAPPQETYATFQCSQFVSKEINSVKLEAAAVAEILAANPARIQVSVGRFYGSLQNVGEVSASTVLVGHSFTGFTTIEPKKATARPTK